MQEKISFPSHFFTFVIKWRYVNKSCFPCIYFLTLILSGIIIRVFKLRRYGWNFADLAFPLFALEYYLISDAAYYHNLLPQLLLALSLLAIGLTIYFLKRNVAFTIRNFSSTFGAQAFSLPSSFTSL